MDTYLILDVLDGVYIKLSTHESLDVGSYYVGQSNRLFMVVEMT